MRRYRDIVQRWLWLLALCALLGGAGAYVGSKLMRPTYRATTLLIVGSPTANADPNSALLASEQLVTTYLGLITQPVVLQRAAAQVPGVSVRQLASQVSVTDQAGTQLIEVAVEDSSPGRAARLANAIAAAFVGIQQDSSSAALTRAQQQVNQQLAQVSAQITALTAKSDALRNHDPTNPQLQVLQDQLTAALAHRDTLQTVSSQLTMQQLLAANSIAVYQPATPPLTPDHPKPLLNAAIGGILGLVVAAALIWLLEFFDDRIRTPRQAEELLDLPVLATVGAYAGGALLFKGASSRKLAKDVHALMANLELAYLSDIPRTIAVTSAVRGEGKTTVAFNLGIALAHKGKRVLLVDGDLHQTRGRDVPGRKRQTLVRAGPSHLDIGELLDSPVALPNPFGLSLVLTGQVPKATPLPSVRGIPELHVLPAGPRVPDPSKLFRSSRMRHCLQWLADDPAGGRFDAIVLDTPPADIYPDAALLAKWADATVLVVDTVHSRDDAVRRVKDIFQRARVSLAGIVLNRASGQVHRDEVDDVGDMDGMDDMGDMDDRDDQVQTLILEPQGPHVHSLVRPEDNGRVDSSTPSLGEPPHGTSGPQGNSSVS